MKIGEALSTAAWLKTLLLQLLLLARLLRVGWAALSMLQLLLLAPSSC